MRQVDCIFIGGGLMGLASALNLAQAGKRVIVLDKDFSGKHASGVNAGGVRSLKRDISELPYIHGSLDMWHNMEKIVGSDCGFYQTGYLVAAEDEKGMKELEARAEATHSLGYTNEILIDKKRLKELAPITRDHCVGGLMSVRDGHASPAETCRAFHAAVIAAGGEVYSNCEVVGVTRGENGFSVKTNSKGTLHSEQLVNCAGAWAGQISRMLGDELPIEPVGASVLVTARMSRLLHTFVAVQGRKLWFNQARNGTLLICGGYHSYVDMEKGLTHMNLHELQACAKVAYDLFDVADDLTIVRSWAGLDGETPDHFPIIGYSKKIPGLMHVCGFSKHGFALSPMVGRVVSAMLQGKKPEIGVEGFEVDRFTGAVVS
ncbi:NAD(P)/FAD-dependent oxidoreductase [Desulforhopalus sp. 52FAK]